VDIADGWNFLMRAYLLGESVLNRSRQLTDFKEVE